MEIVIRSAIVFFFLWFVTRAMGKRELAQMSAFELVLLVVFGDLVQQGVTQEDTSVVGAFLAVGTIAFLTIAFSALSFRSKRAAQVIGGRPVIVVRDGRPLEDALRYERLSVDDVKDAAREQGIASIDDIAVGILEPSGKFSFITKDAAARQQGQGSDSIAR
jgi:uncharacterized membrane protein YcaP (DUF421 family)